MAQQADERSKLSKRQLNVLGKRIREIRGKQELTLIQLAARCGVLGWEVTHNTLGKIEAGQRSIFDLEVWVLAKALRLKTDDLYPRFSADKVAALSRRPAKKR